MKSNNKPNPRDGALVVVVAAVSLLAAGPRPSQAVTVINTSNFPMSVTITSEDGDSTDFEIIGQSEISHEIGTNLRVRVKTMGGKGYWSHTVSATNRDEVIINVRSASPVHVPRLDPHNLDIQVRPIGTSETAAARGSVERRNVEFLATADPQYANNSEGQCLTPGSCCFMGNEAADRTMARMRHHMNTTSYSGVIIAGDLTQDTRAYEYCHYAWQTGAEVTYSDPAVLCPPFYDAPDCDWKQASTSYDFYDGLGNHDYNMGPSCHTFEHAELRGWVKRSRRTPVWRSTLYNSLHYSWNWDDVHFIQLNLFPGTETTSCFCDCSDGCDPYDSTLVLGLDLVTNVHPNYDMPIVIIHHYGPDKIGENGGWPLFEARDYWDTIRDYNVVAILFGHTNRSPDDCSRFDFDQPYLADDRPDGRTSIPAFEAGSAKGNPIGSNCIFGRSPGAYTYINVNKGHQINIERREDDGDVVFEWCLPIDSDFYMRESASSNFLQTGTIELPFSTLANANDAIQKFDRNCSLERNQECDTIPGDLLPLPTLYLEDTRLVEPIRLDAPMRIVKWN